jgi:hypothetical protein
MASIIQSLDATIVDVDAQLGFARVRSIGSAVRVESARYRAVQRRSSAIVRDAWAFFLSSVSV